MSGFSPTLTPGSPHRDSSLSADRCELLTQLFDLLSREARLALARGRGTSIMEAAREFNLTGAPRASCTFIERSHRDGALRAARTRPKARFLRNVKRSSD